MNQVSTDVKFEKALSNSLAYNAAMSVAETLSNSNFIPKEFKNNSADCLIALIMSEQLKINPVTLMQQMHIINGKPGFSAKFAVSMANKSGKFKDDIAFEVCGKDGDKDITVTAFATLQNGQRAEATVSLEMARAEGWTARNKKYNTMPTHMLKYRAATFLVNEYCPELLMGFHTKEELEDIHVETVQEKKELLAESLGIVETEVVDDRVSKMLGWFAELPVPLDEGAILAFLGLESVDDINEEHLVLLREEAEKIKKEMKNG